MASATKTRQSAEMFAKTIGLDPDLVEDPIERWEGVWEWKTIIAPELADSLLQRNTQGNRLIRGAKVDAMARDMKAERWRSDVAGPIVFTSDGVLIQGQHRLSACARSGVALYSEIRIGVDAAAIEVMDTGIPRSLADRVRMRGYPNASALAAIVRLYQQVASGMARAYQPSDLESLELLAARLDEMVAACRKAQQVRQTIGLVLTPLAVVILRANDLGMADEAGEFIEQIKSGLDADGNPVPNPGAVRVLREWAFRQSAAPRSRTRATPLYTYAVAQKAWNAWVTNEPVKLLKWAPGEALPDPMAGF